MRLFPHRRPFARALLVVSASAALIGGLLPNVAFAESAAPTVTSTSTPTPTPTSTSTTEPTPAATPSEPAPTRTPVPRVTPTSTPVPRVTPTPDPLPTDIPDPQTTYAPPPVAQVEREDLADVVSSTPLQEKDAAGDVTPDVADPGNVPYPASGSSGSVDGASSARLSLVAPKEGIVSAAAVVGFAAGNIISDAVFTNKGTMTDAKIRSFIDGKVAACQSGYTCLENYRETTPTRAADAYCAKYTGGSREDAARIVYKVAQACGINPQVLLVMLQKEQGLVTHTWPSDFRFTIAMGMGCPDTAECDKLYYGFFNQVYGAARQMKIYGRSSYFTWYAPGGTRAIQYHPNASCGSSGVYVKNQATADLYYYTPYQPNAAALAAGTGTGDSCSSYGNRNFYSYFRTWFGSTGGGSTTPPAVTTPLVKYGAEIWLIAGSNRYHVTPEAYPEYKRALGAPSTVTSAQLSKYANRGTGGLFVKNVSTGVVALLQGGQTHRFPTCTLVAQWGGSCGAGLVQLPSALFTKFAAGSQMTVFARVSAGGRFYRIEGTLLKPLFDARTARVLYGTTVPYAAVMPSAGRAKNRVSTVLRFAPRQFLTIDGRSGTWIAIDGARLIRLPNWQRAADLGLPGKVTMFATEKDVKGYTFARDPLPPFVTCSGTHYIAAAGRLHAIAGTIPSGFGMPTYDGDSCARFNRNGVHLAGNHLFVKAPGHPEVYLLQNGQLRHISSYNVLLRVNGGKAPTILTWQVATIASYPKGKDVR